LDAPEHLHRDIRRRNELVRNLFDEHKIAGWLTSVENRGELEVCLFDRQSNANQLRLADTVDRENAEYFRDSPDRMTISPACAFYDRTREKFSARAPLPAGDGDHYTGYRRKMDGWIQDAVRNGMNITEAEHDHLNLRTKLSI
jgi:hypothetical protein